MFSSITVFVGRRARLVVFVAMTMAALSAAGAIGWITAPVA